MRIADATEKMASNYTKLQTDLEMYKRWYNDKKELAERLTRSNNALRGYINLIFEKEFSNIIKLL